MSHFHFFDCWGRLAPRQTTSGVPILPAFGAWSLGGTGAHSVAAAVAGLCCGATLVQSSQLPFGHGLLLCPYPTTERGRLTQQLNAAWLKLEPPVWDLLIGDLLVNVLHHAQHSEFSALGHRAKGWTNMGSIKNLIGAHLAGILQGGVVLPGSIRTVALAVECGLSVFPCPWGPPCLPASGALL